LATIAARVAASNARSVHLMNSSDARSHDIDPVVWRVAVVTVLGTIMSVLDTTIVYVALDTLHHRLRIPLADTQWIISGYLLALATVIPLTGWTTRRFGARRVYLTSLMVFTAGSALCGIAGSAAALVAFRVIQGIGGGMIMPVGQMILAGVAGPTRMGRVMSVTGVPTMLAPILGPTIGGLILASASWRWIFFVNLPIGGVAFVLARKILPSDSGYGPRRRLDIGGLLLMATGMPLLTYGLTQIGNAGAIDATTVLVPLIVGTLLIVGFVWRCTRTSAPLLDMRLYRHGTYAAASAVLFFLGGALAGSLILLPLYYQQIRHLNTIDTGLLLAPQSIGMVLVMPFVGRLTDRLGAGPLVVPGVAIMTLATVPLGLLSAQTNYVWLSLVLTIRGAGVGLAIMPAFAAAFAALDRGKLPDAAPQMNVVMRLGSSIGVAVLTVVLARAIASDPRAPASAYGTAFWWSLCLSATCAIPGWVLWRSERRTRAALATATGSELERGPITEIAV
jgi:EmrB/QacA subfamily drug resistance transporter